MFLLKRTHTQADGQTDRRTCAWGRGGGKARVLLVISSRYTNTKGLCVSRRSAEFLSGSRPHSLRFLQPREARGGRLCAPRSSHTVETPQEARRVFVEVAPRDKTRQGFSPLYSSATLSPCCQSADISGDGIQLPTETSSKLGGGDLGQTFRVEPWIAVNHWRGENSWQRLESFSQDVSTRMSKVLGFD